MANLAELFLVVAYHLEYKKPIIFQSLSEVWITENSSVTFPAIIPNIQ